MFNKYVFFFKNNIQSDDEQTKKEINEENDNSIQFKEKRIKSNESDLERKNKEKK